MKVDIDEAPDFAGRYSVRSVPTLTLFVEGRQVATQAGMMSEGQLARFVDQHLPAAARNPVDQDPNRPQVELVWQLVGHGPTATDAAPPAGGTEANAASGYRACQRGRAAAASAARAPCPSRNGLPARGDLEGDFPAAGDVVDETLVRAWHELRGRPQANLGKGTLYRIASRVLADAVRQRCRERGRSVSLERRLPEQQALDDGIDQAVYD